MEHECVVKYDMHESEGGKKINSLLEGIKVRENLWWLFWFPHRTKLLMEQGLMYVIVRVVEVVEAVVAVD